MKRVVARSPWVALALLGLTSCGGEGGPGTTDTEEPRASSITISRSSVAFTYLGESSSLIATVKDQFGHTFNATITWSIDDPSVATVGTLGLLTAVGNGTTTARATSGNLSASATVTVQQVAARVTVVSGGEQTGTVGGALGQPVVVETQDQGGAPVPGATVAFATAGGTVSAASVTTDGNARASITWTLGTTAGSQTLTASIVGSTSASVQVNATALPGPATAVAKSSGDQQTVPVGFAVFEPVIAKVTDQYGNGISGQSVSFTVTGGGGSVTPAQGTTGANGTAQATWTVGPAVGENTLSVASPGLPAVVYTATAAEARPDLEAGPPMLLPANPTILETVEVTARVDNVGYLDAAAGAQAQLLVDGVDAGSVALPALAMDAWTEARFTVAPLAEGNHTFRVVLDPGNALAEWDETNNAGENTADVAATTLLTAGQPVANLSAPDSVEYLFTLVVSPDEPGTLEVTLSGGTGDADLYVHHGHRPANRDDYECQSGNPDTTERCVINAAEPGTYYILIFAWDEYSGTTLLATTGGPVIPYDIELVYIDHGTPDQDAVFATAAARWMEIIPGDISDFDFGPNPVAADACFPGQPFVNDLIDDLRIYVSIIEIDGAGGTLAQAGPCVIRGLGKYPIFGLMQFDSADMDGLAATGGLLPVVLHEMAHVLGLGTIWDDKNLLQNPSLPSSPGVDTWFSGPRAIEAFDAAGGLTVYTGGNKVPVANIGGEGSQDGHWRESVLGVELMTPGYNSGVTNPLSAITIESMADLGYTVDITQADPFTPIYHAPGQESSVGPVIDLGGDIRRGPVWIVDGKGKMRLRRQR